LNKAAFLASQLRAAYRIPLYRRFNDLPKIPTASFPRSIFVHL
jgi:hypothetical protein